MTFRQHSGKSGVSERLRSREWLWRWWFWLLVAILLGVVAYTQLGRSAKAQQGAGKTGAPPPPAVPVVAVAAKKGDVGVYLNGLGTVTPLATVTVKSRVDGELFKVQYKEGQIVKKGQLLVEIDPRPFEAQLTQAQGQMIRDQALLRNARLDLERYRTLAGQDSIARQQYDTQKSLVRQLEGTVKFDQGQIDNAKLQIIYSKITCPVTGRIGLRLVDPGNIVHATDTTGLCVIAQLEPITVIFTLPEDSLPPLLDKVKAGERLPVDAFNREQTKKLASGFLLTLDNQIDTNTGTVRLRAQFANKDHGLFPNQFVNARLLLETKRDTIVVPTAAVQRSPKGAYVFLIKEDQTVTVRQVRLGPTEGDNTSIEEGLAPGERVVVEGAERLKEGTNVAVKAPGAGKTPSPGAGKAPSPANGKAPKGK